MDTRFTDLGYTAELLTGPHGAYLSILRRGVVVGEVAIAAFEFDTPVRVLIKRFRPNELREVTVIDAFD